VIAQPDFAPRLNVPLDALRGHDHLTHNQHAERLQELIYACKEAALSPTRERLHWRGMRNGWLVGNNLHVKDIGDIGEAVVREWAQLEQPIVPDTLRGWDLELNGHRFQVKTRIDWNYATDVRRRQGYTRPQAKWASVDPAGDYGTLVLVQMLADDVRIWVQPKALVRTTRYGKHNRSIDWTRGNAPTWLLRPDGDLSVAYAALRSCKPVAQTPQARGQVTFDFGGAA